ncbi:hypothetical protein NX868_25075 [Burkholderia thailandensis]|uniref:hypothetical protein n=1 Tax=Burkholderia thailandensis TaxID=57975 RepID=UPI000A2F3166|nr:hypothetical protein [Burkholderia thailandensis]AVR29151.1 hypothetical protein A8H32_30885 [Burkholderia thailandensis]MCS3394591.1 hypothetical protein [Burkholderia thailandensis]MCS6427653.1 hypothetical protein [Burkholderia thailandensis]MCS6455903.1 hypothetical protein [Burkholderia thailandensis]MCS6466818.1 hypothetical protein [Burkholderia thailandensis]
MTDASERKRLIAKRAAWAYLCALGIPAVVLVFSYAQGASWKPVLVGLPVYLTIIGSITYQFIKDLRALKRESEDSSSNSEEQ